MKKQTPQEEALWRIQNAFHACERLIDAFGDKSPGGNVDLEYVEMAYSYAKLALKEPKRR